MGSDRGIGASLPRKEDHRLLHGRGEFVADIAMPGTMDVAFVRSPLAHARMAGLTKPAGHEERVFAATDLGGVRPIVARSGLPGFKVSEQPVLAVDRVRYAGELIAACLGETNEASPQTDKACGAYHDLTVEADSDRCSALRTDPRSWSL